MQNNYLSTEKLKIMVNNLPKDFTDEETDLFLEGLVKQGYILQNYNDQGYQPPKQPVGLIRKIGAGIVNPVENVANTAFDVVGAGADHLGQKMREGMGMSSDGLSFQERLQREGKTNSNMSGFIDPEQNSQTRDVTTTTGLKQLAGDVALTATNLIPAGKVAKGAGLMTQIGKGAVDGIKIGGLAGAGSALQKDGDIGDVAMESGYGALTGAAFGGVMPLAEKAFTGTAKFGKNLVTQGGREAVSEALPEGMITSHLNDQINLSAKRLKDQNIDPSILHNTYAEAQKISKVDVSQKAALEIIGDDIGNAFDKIIAKRKEVGKLVGSELDKISKQPLQVDDITTAFSKQIKKETSGKQIKYSSAEANMLQNFNFELKSLGKNPTAEEISNFVTRMRSEIDVLKGKNGVIGTTNAERLIAKATSELNDKIATNFPQYAGAKSEYARLSGLLDDGVGFLGQKIGDSYKKETSLVKSSLNSILNGGKKDFLLQLEKETGEPILDKAVIAAQVMEDFGDGRGASLLQKLTEGDIPTSAQGAIAKLADAAVKKTWGKVGGSLEYRTKRHLAKNYALPLNAENITANINNINTANNIPPAISNIFNIINQSLENGNLATVKTLLETLSPYAKTQLIKMLSEEYR